MKKLIVLMFMFCFQLHALEMESDLRSIESVNEAKLKNGLTRINYKMSGGLRVYYIDNPGDLANWRFSENQGGNPFYVGEDLEILPWFALKPNEAKLALFGSENMRFVDFNPKELADFPTFISQKYENVTPDSWFFPTYAYVTTLSDGTKWITERSWRSSSGKSGDKVLVSKWKDGTYQLISLERIARFYTPDGWVEKGYTAQKYLYMPLNSLKVKRFKGGQS